MPPWCGTPEEAELLTDYLMTINPPRPAGMHIGTENVNLPSPNGRGAGGEGSLDNREVRR